MIAPLAGLAVRHRTTQARSSTAVITDRAVDAVRLHRRLASGAASIARL